MKILEGFFFTMATWVVLRDKVEVISDLLGIFLAEGLGII
jgi:hypothetical protein